jgi:hypothetical protein
LPSHFEIYVGTSGEASNLAIEFSTGNKHSVPELFGGKASRLEGRIESL